MIHCLHLMLWWHHHRHYGPTCRPSFVLDGGRVCRAVLSGPPRFRFPFQA